MYNLSLYIHTCAHIYLCTCEYIYIYIYIYLYIYTYAYVVCIYIRSRSDMHIITSFVSATSLHLKKETELTLMRLYMRTYLHTIHTHIHIYIHTCIHCHCVKSPDFGKTRCGHSAGQYSGVYEQG